MQKEYAAAGHATIASEQWLGRPAAELCDAAIIEGSILYRDQLGLLTELRNRLKANGRLVLFGENLLDDTRIEYSELANLSSLLQQAERLGYTLLHQQDFSQGAKASLELLSQILTADRTRLCRQLNWDSIRMDALLVTISHMAEEFECGRRCFRLLEFIRMVDTTDNYPHAVYEGINSVALSEIRPLFEASFGVDFDEELWIWKYPSDSDNSVVIREHAGGEVMSFYGGVPRQIEYFGEFAMAIQCCDIMVLPSRRRHYGRKSLFFKTAATFLEREVGNTVRHLLGFGFPNQKVMRYAMRLGLYGKTDEFVEVVFSEPFLSSSSIEGMFIDADLDNPEHRKSVDSLWQQMRIGFANGIIGLRDSGYMHHRYVQHPFARRGQFKCRFVLNNRNQIVALVVMKVHEDLCLLMDIVCPWDELRFSLELTARLTAASEAMSMKFWITRGWLERLTLDSCTVNSLGINIPCNNWNPGPSANKLAGAWWLTAGDMDFM